MTKKPQLQGPIFLLFAVDEVRHPYQVALEAVGPKISWFETYDTLMLQQDEPVVLIADLDYVKQPVERELEHIRAHFPSSELIALSSVDSAQLALASVRAGFSDFLLKPVSPEEITYNVRKAIQRQDFFTGTKSTKRSLVQVITQISGCTTPSLVRIYTLEYVNKLFNAKGSAWLKLDPRGTEYTQILCTSPKKLEASKIIFSLPTGTLPAKANAPTEPVLIRKKQGDRKAIVRCDQLPQEALFFWGIKKPLTTRQTRRARRVLGHSEVCLSNQQKFEEVKQQTFVDDLTGLYNSRYLKYAITNSILRCKGPNQFFSVLFIDVDHFKAINDSHSHLVGSEFLVTIGKTIKNAVRRIDPVFRYGGDEFVVILQGSGTDGAKEIAERIRKNIERRIFIIQGERIQTTVSIGIATFPLHAADRETLLRMADEAMYGAKRASRNAVHMAGEPITSTPQRLDKAS